MSDRAIRVAIAVAGLPVEETDLLFDVLFGLDGRFQRAVNDLSDEAFAAMASRSLGEIVADIENGTPLARDEIVLVNRLAAQIPPRSSKQFVAEWQALIRSIVDEFGPGGSVLGQADWLRERLERFISAADFKRTRFAAIPPYADRQRALLWRLAQFGPLPRDRKLREIISGN